VERILLRMEQRIEKRKSEILRENSPKARRNHFLAKVLALATCCVGAFFFSGMGLAGFKEGSVGTWVFGALFLAFGVGFAKAAWDILGE